MEVNIYVDVEREIRKEYVQRFGEESLEYYYRYFTRDEQIERYAENLIFWLERMDKIDLTEFGSKDFAKSYIVSNATCSLIKKMESTLPSDIVKEVIEKIWTRTPELIGKSLVLPVLAYQYGIFKEGSTESESECSEGSQTEPHYSQADHRYCNICKINVKNELWKRHLKKKSHRKRKIKSSSGNGVGRINKN